MSDGQADRGQLGANPLVPPLGRAQALHVERLPDGGADAQPGGQRLVGVLEEQLQPAAGGPQLHATRRQEVGTLETDRAAIGFEQPDEEHGEG